jgi:hypothetical protein
VIRALVDPLNRHGGAAPGRPISPATSAGSAPCRPRQREASTSRCR